MSTSTSLVSDKIITLPELAGVLERLKRAFLADLAVAPTLLARLKRQIVSANFANMMADEEYTVLARFAHYEYPAHQTVPVLARIIESLRDSRISPDAIKVAAIENIEQTERRLSESALSTIDAIPECNTPYREETFNDHLHHQFLADAARQKIFDITHPSGKHF